MDRQVEGRAQLVSKLADDDAPYVRQLTEDPKSPGADPGIGIVVADHAIELRWINGFDGHVEFVEVLPGPLDLGARPGELSRQPRKHVINGFARQSAPSFVASGSIVERVTHATEPTTPPGSRPSRGSSVR